jgi:hypothetical protein
MRTPRLPVVDLTDAPADLNRLVRFAERRNLVSPRVPSHFKRSLPLVCIDRTFHWFIQSVYYIIVPEWNIHREFLRSLMLNAFNTLAPTWVRGCTSSAVNSLWCNFNLQYSTVQYSTGLVVRLQRNIYWPRDIAAHSVFICCNSLLSVVPTQPFRPQRLQR